ncbi:polymerase [Alsobacter metallidurans]|uniref:Porin n=1 Tax=Alsobacter metallidurans TaxID=340221 RepID=A0A917I6B2_9HYPH|nr:porin [Alsobacter metallidurans]GGH15445.1 polymerase [Alsobacter metallidurans]
MNIKTRLLMATAAGIATVSGAQAADLPSKKAAPVEYVRVCSTFGAGFFYIPGTDTCIRIGGRARFEYQYGEPFARNDATTGSRTTGRIYVDARTATEYGLLRAYVRYDISRRIGQIYSGSAIRVGTAFTGTGVDYAGQAQTQVDLNRAFVQFGGLTAGRTQSFFDFYGGDLEYVGTTAGSSLTTNLLAYTASFGGGFSATLSLEDAQERRSGLNTGNALLPGGTLVGTYAYTGDSIPDVVANLRVDQAWGSVQLSGALHQIRVGNYAAFGGLTPSANAPDSEYGWAVNLGTKINLPMLAPGDTLYLQGTYTKGAPSYILSNPFGLGKTAWNFGGTGAIIPDAYLVGTGAINGIATYDIEKPAVWGLTAAMLHYWTPTIRQAFMASYIKSDAPGSTYAAFGTAAGVGAGTAFSNRARDLTYWTLGTNVTWSPIKDLDIGAEVNYIHANVSNGLSQTFVGSDPIARSVKNDSVWNTRLKIQRDF